LRNRRRPNDVQEREYAYRSEADLHQGTAFHIWSSMALKDLLARQFGSQDFSLTNTGYTVSPPNV
jgi:hypothetical protein